MTIAEDVAASIRSETSSELVEAEPVKFAYPFAIAFALLAIGALVLILVPELHTPTIHAILDTSTLEVSAVLCLLFWQLSLRGELVLARFLAITFTFVVLAETVHTVTAIAWSSSYLLAGPETIRRIDSTWAPSCYLLPIGLLVTSLLRLRHRFALLIHTALMLLLTTGLLLLFDALPRSFPGLSNLNQPAEAIVPLAWIGVMLSYWRGRNIDDARLVSFMAAVSIIPHTVMLYSTNPADPADPASLFAHFGKLLSDLFLLLGVTQMGAQSAIQLQTIERKLRHFNQQLEARIHERTSELERVNAGLQNEVGRREQAERSLLTQVDRLKLLNQITRAIGDRLDLGSIFQVVVFSIEESLPVDFAAVFTLNLVRRVIIVSTIGSRGESIARQLRLEEGAEVPVDDTGISLLLDGGVVYEPDISCMEAPFFRAVQQAGLQALVVAPLMVEKKAFGILVAGRGEKASFEASDCEFIGQLSEQVSLAIHQAELRDTLRHAYDDLKATQQAALQQERLRALGQMASGIAHDINNAISPVAIYTQSLLEGETTPRIRSYLETVRRVTNDVAATVGRMREFYRQREVDHPPTPVQLSDMVEQVIELTRARWSDMSLRRGVVITVRQDIEIVPLIQGIENELREALTNLIFNAIDAMPQGGTMVVATRSIEHRTPAGAFVRRVELSVSDTGVGMDEKTKRRCFEPFFTTKGERGTGLGLAMVYGTAKRHDAAIDVESEIGKGTTVRLTFDAFVLPAELPAKAEKAVIPTPALTILLIDDDPFVLDSLHVVLEAEGHIVIEATGGQAGIDAFQAAHLSGKPFDVVVTDLGMPYVDGIQVIESLKLQSPETPILLLTGWGGRVDADGSSTTQADFVLAKPPDLDDLRDVFSRCAPRAARPA